MAKEITGEQVNAILEEAKHLDLTFGTSKAHETRAVSVASFKLLWPKVRGYVLAAISVLQLFHRGDAAAAVAQFVAFVDLIVGGQLPIA